MTRPTDPAGVASILLSQHDCDLVSCKIIQRLWAGYGQICTITARARSDDAARTVSRICDANENEAAKAGHTFQLILKLISAPKPAIPDEGHLRKMLSYEVEGFFYTQIVPRLEGLGVAKCLASTHSTSTSTSASASSSDSKDGGSGDDLPGCMAILMADLRTTYPVSGEKRSLLSSTQVHGCLEWLSSFHSRWDLIQDPAKRGYTYLLPPLEEYARRTGAGMESSKVSGESGAGKGVWLNGGYTYLSTRRKEYASLVDEASEWSNAFCTPFSSTMSSSTAEVVATCLTPRGRGMESLIHGDVKSENLFTSRSGSEVAFFDFQYVGLGLGVCDLAKLFTCSVPLAMLLNSDSDSDSEGHGQSAYVPESLSMCTGEKALLERYRASLLRGKGDASSFYDWDTFVRHWETALVDWCRFQASWGFWGNTEWLMARVMFILGDEGWRAWVENDVKV